MGKPPHARDAPLVSIKVILILGLNHRHRRKKDKRDEQHSLWGILGKEHLCRLRTPEFLDKD
jgi:hypothetical protein